MHLDSNRLPQRLAIRGIQRQRRVLEAVACSADRGQRRAQVVADGSEDRSLHGVALPQRLSLHRLSCKPARARRQLTHDDGGHEIGRERNPVCGVPQSERVNGWKEEKVERQQGGDANGDRVRQSSKYSDRDDGNDIEDAEAQDGCGRAEYVDRSGDSGNGSDAQPDALRQLDCTAPCHEDPRCGHTTALFQRFLQHVRPVLVLRSGRARPIPRAGRAPPPRRRRNRTRGR